MAGSLLTVLQCADRTLSLSHPHVMGVLNVTPDSFSDGGQFVSPDLAVSQAKQMVEDGATIIDVGGESTRPGAEPVSESEELDRVIPVIKQLKQSRVDAVISVDTSSPAVMMAAAEAGAGLINDVRALSRPGALIAAKNTTLPICLMHMQGSPEIMQNAPDYQQLMADICGFFYERIQACIEVGIRRESLLLDPGFGFGKTLDHNTLILKQLAVISEFELPVLVGMSRKSMIGAIVDKPVDQRLYGSLAAAVIAVQHGATIVRVHDVGPTVDALKVAAAVISS